MKCKRRDCVIWFITLRFTETYFENMFQNIRYFEYLFGSGATIGTGYVVMKKEKRWYSF